MAIATTTALAIAAVAVAAAGTGVAVAGQMEAAEAAEKAGRYNQKVAANNAEASRLQAQYESERIAKRNKIILGRQKAAVAKSGILDTGSPLEVFESSAIEGELDRMAALYAGDVRAQYHLSAGELARMEGSSAARANYYRAGGTLLSGTASAARQYNYSSGPSFED